MSASDDVDSFRLRARNWLAENMKQGNAERPGQDGDGAWFESQRVLQRRLFDAGFAGIMYPVEYGGLGLTRAHQQAFKEEASGYVMPVSYAVSHGILGPTILDFGTEEQKKKYLPGTLAGDIWVQFLSEPSAGSDMASALTRATRIGETYVINGSKIWTTGAQYADYALALCRTNWDAPKHQGLSMFIVPIRSPGVTVNPIKLVDGSTHFCQEFFDDVVVPAANLVGEENNGWTVASRLLAHERSMTGGVSLNDTIPRGGGLTKTSRVDDLVELAMSVGLARDPVTRQQVGEGLVLNGLQSSTVDRVAAGMRSGAIAGPGAALLKLMSALVAYRREQLAFEIAGPRSFAWPEDSSSSSPGISFLAARGVTIAGGSNEVLRNQISERILGLPREFNPDKDLPFSQTQRNAAQ